MIITKNSDTNIKQNELFNISKFVVKENFSHHTNKASDEEHINDIEEIYQEEKIYLENSEIFTVKTADNEIVGTIRALKWNFINPLPIQKMFGINPLHCTNGMEINEIWHIGRFAIKKGSRDLCLLKKLMVSAIKPICAHKNNLAFAECDAKLLRIMTLMGIKTKIVGASIHYLGSETIPVSMSYDGLIEFYNDNKYLIDSEDLNKVSNMAVLPNRAVFSA